MRLGGARFVVGALVSPPKGSLSMLVPFLIMLREGVEAALIVGIIAGYLKVTGRTEWMPLVWVGIVVAVLLCLGLGILLDLLSADFPQREQELFEAVVGLVAVGLLTSMVFWMRKAARSIKGHLHESIDAAIGGNDARSFALVAMVFFAVAVRGSSRCSSCSPRSSSRWASTRPSARWRACWSRRGSASPSTWARCG